MGLFKDVLRSDQTLFKNQDALDYEFLPKILPYREQEQRKVASVIQPLTQDRPGRNAFIYGPPGIGKTAAIRAVLRDLEEETDVKAVYINCWNKNSTFKILLEMCDALDFKFTQNKRTEELFKIVKQMLNRKKVVFAFDEIDKVEDFDFLYNIIEEIHHKSVLLITNYKEWLTNLDERIRSRLLPELVEFKQYNAEETRGILKQRMGYAFQEGVWENAAFELMAKKTAEIKDIRTGLYLMKEATLLAEAKSQKNVTLKNAEEAIAKLSEFHSKETEELGDEEYRILDIIKKHAPAKIGELFEKYQKDGGQNTYKTFQRKIDKLEKGKFITCRRTEGGKEGNTTLITYGEVKKLTEF